MSEHGGPEGLASATIYAEATAFGAAGIAVVRVSGPCARIVMDRLTGQTKIKARHATRVNIYRSHDGELLDSALALWFPKPNSFTGEDVVELHTHGSRAVVNRLLETLGDVPGFRMAEPGEFTRRAFENMKIDLTAAEGLVDLIEAETTMQSKQAIRQMQGGLGKIYEGWRKRIIQNLSYLEATIDFSDEERDGAIFTLHKTLSTILKLLAPITPFITEHLWKTLYSNESIHQQKQVDFENIEEQTEITKAISEFNSKVWNEKKSQNLSLKDSIKIDIPEILQPFKKDLKSMHNLLD